MEKSASAARPAAEHLDEDRLDSLFNPASLALVGASPRADSYGHALLRMCRGGGYAGRLYAVNPQYEEIDGLPGYADLDALPEAPEHVVLSLANQRVEAAAAAALEGGARALTIFAATPDAALRRRLGEMARAAGAALCGPNSMGLHNIVDGLRLTPFSAPLGLQPGGIGLIAQSGSIMGALAHNDRRLRFSQLISTGAESATGAADYLRWMLRRAETRCVGLFLETVRQPQRFIAALQEAAERDIPVVIMKVGRSEAGARLAVSHTGALVGDDAVFRALVRRCGAHLADTVDEFAAQLQLFSTARRAPQADAVGAGIASLHDSGGERELIADLAESLDLRHATLRPQTLARLQSLLEAGIEADNPLDAWGSGRDAERSYREAGLAMLADPGVAALLYVLDWRQDYYLHAMHARALGAIAAASDKPLAAVSNYSLCHDAELAEALAERGVALIKGTREALLATRALLEHRRPAAFRSGDDEHPQAAAWRARLRGRQWIGEAEGYRLCADYGIACPRHAEVERLDDCLAAAAQIGYPLMLKTAAPGIAHKSDVGGVRAAIGDAEELAAAYRDLAARLGPRVLLVEMLDSASEWALGALIDPDFGPAVRIGPGGTLVELLDEQVLLMAPFDAAEAERAVAELRAARLLRGYRGAPPLDSGALCAAAAALSRLAWDLRESLAEIEINPLFVARSGAIAADALCRTVAPEAKQPLDPPG